MKTTIITIAILMTTVYGFAQQAKSGQVTKYVTTFPNGEEAITIVDNANSDTLNLSSAESFYKYEILAPANHELIHGSQNKGKVCEIDKTKLSDGTYTLKVYTADFIITSDITIKNSEENKGASI
jgi:hypothetical protein